MKQLEREYWSLEMAAKSLNTKPNDLIHAAALGRIQLCVNLFRMTEEVSTLKMPPPYRSSDYETSEEKREIQSEFEKANWDHWHRARRAMPVGIYELAYDDARRMESSENDTITMEWSTRFDGKDWWLVELGPSVEVNLKKIVVRQEEIEKFQTSGEDRLGGVGGREHTAYLNIIGILAHILRNRPGKDLSEAALIQSILTTEMKLRPDPNGRPLYGLSERSLQDKLKHARHSLEMSTAQLQVAKNREVASSMLKY